MSKPSAKQIAEWKSSFGNLFLIKIEDEELYLKDPYTDEGIIKLAISAARAGGMVQYTLAIVNNCLIHGNRNILNDVGSIEAIRKQIAEVVEPPITEVVKKDDQFEISSEGVRLEFRLPTREDLIVSESRNPGGMPLETEIALLRLCAIDLDKFDDARKSNTRAWLGIVLEANAIKEEKRATVVKL